MTENLFRDDKLSVAVKADAEREIKKEIGIAHV